MVQDRFEIPLLDYACHGARVYARFLTLFFDRGRSLGRLGTQRMQVQLALDAPLLITFRSHHLATGLSISKNRGALERFLGRAMVTSVADRSHRKRPLENLVGNVHSEEGRCASAVVFSLLR